MDSSPQLPASPSQLNIAMSMAIPPVPLDELDEHITKQLRLHLPQQPDRGISLLSRKWTSDISK